MSIQVQEVDAIPSSSRGRGRDQSHDGYWKERVAVLNGKPILLQDWNGEFEKLSQAYGNGKGYLKEMGMLDSVRLVRRSDSLYLAKS